MADRRSLVEGLKSTPKVDPTVEQQFVYGKGAKTPSPKEAAPTATKLQAEEGKAKTQQTIGRAPFTTRIRTDYAAALKRASLERQLQGVFPNTLQDILEEALQPWLRSNGYLDTPGSASTAN
jgi:hypothetical protein